MNEITTAEISAGLFPSVATKGGNELDEAALDRLERQVADRVLERIPTFKDLNEDGTERGTNEFSIGDPSFDQLGKVFR